MGRLSSRQAMFAAALAGVAVVGFTAQHVDPLASVRASLRYHSSDFGTIETVGVCDPTGESLRCWDADGKIDRNLTRTIARYAASRPLPKVERKAGSKTRLIVLKRPTYGLGNTETGGVGLAYFPEFEGHAVYPAGDSRGLSGGGGQTMQIPPEPMVSTEAKQEPYLVWYTISAPQEQRTAAMDFNLAVSFGQKAIPLEVGAEAEFGPFQMRITAIKPGEDRLIPEGGKKLPARKWIVSVAGRYSGPKWPAIMGDAILPDGSTVKHVYFDGEPALWDGNGKRQGQGKESGPTTWGGLESTRATSDEAAGLEMYCNPARVSKISLTARGTRKLTLTDIPLDPL